MKASCALLVTILALPRKIQQIWYARLRQIDMRVLWPQCVELAPDLDRAKAAFAVHAFNDSAWMVLGEAEVYALIDRLERP